MNMTNSGTLVTSEAGVPSLTDIAIGLSRAARFAGQGRRWWSVLDHSLVVEEIARGAGMTDAVRLAALLHDAHECVTGDVPTGFKPHDLRITQRLIDQRIFDTFFARYGGYAGFRQVKETVAALDARALAAEAQVVGPPNATHDHFGRPESEDIEAVMLVAVQASAPSVYDPLSQRNVRDFIRLLRELM